MSNSKGALPQHVAFIMDGNGRWAQARGLPRLEGHRKGVDAIHRTVDAAIELGIPFVSFYAFSTENWKRPEDEVAGLMHLLKTFVTRELARLQKAGVRLRFIGDRSAHSKLGPELLKLLDAAESATVGNDKITVCICLNYGARAEILHAVKQLIIKDIASEAIDEDVFASCLYTKDIPDPDLCVRTSGEQRLSNFLLWQLAYAELIFTPVAWPDFGKDALQDAIDAYTHRERRFGEVLSA